MLYRMRLLFITQAVDERDSVLGFVCNWLRVFVEQFSYISVVCLRKGECTLSKNVSVYSLGKERGGNKLSYTLRFLRYVWRERREYNAVFVHMNQEYILLAGVWWRLIRKPVALWYNHTAGTFWTKIAMRLATVVFHTSPYAFTAGSSKSIRMPAGIDTKLFMPVAEIARAPHSILYLGRIAPIKGVHTLIEAALFLRARNVDFFLTICGDALPRDFAYEQKVHILAKPLIATGQCNFLPAITNVSAPRLFSEHELFVNLTPAGNYDKTVLEAAACECLPVVSSPAFRDTFPPELFFEERSPASLADAIERVFAISEEKKEKLRTLLREYVVKNHNLILLAEKMKDIFFQKRIYYITNARMPTEKAHGIQIAKMSEALRARGANLTLVIPRRHAYRQAGGKSDSLKEFYNLTDDIPLIRLPVLPYGWSFWLGSFSFMLVAFLFLLYRKMVGERFLVYTIDMDQFSFALLPFLRAPYFVEIHDAKRRGILFHWLFSRAQGVLTINHIIKKKLCERFGMPEQKVLVAPNGISDEFFRAGNISKEEARRALDLPREKRIALYAGQLYAWKGLEIFADAARLAPDIFWCLAGGTREVFEKITGIRHIPNNLVFGGIRPYREMPLLMAAADTLIVLGTRHDEYSYYHTSPMKLFEYLPVGRPIIAARTPAIADMVSEREVFFYEPDNAENMAAVVQEAIQNTSAASDKTRAARTLAEKYTWQKRAELVLKYIKWL